MTSPAETGHAAPAEAPLPTDPAQIEAEIAAGQSRLASSVDELTTRLQPKEVARRAAESAQTRIQTAMTDEKTGELRKDRVIAAGLSAAALLGALLLGKKKRHQ